MKPGLFAALFLPGRAAKLEKRQRMAARRVRRAQELAAGQQGLVHAAYLHNSTLAGAPGARCVEVKYPHRGEPPEGGKRGKIVGRSMASCRSFRKLMACILVGATPLEFTVTYPGEFPEDPKRWKLNLRSLLVAVQRKWRSAAGVWVLEKQERGAPHYHILVFNLDKYIVGYSGLAAKPKQEQNKALASTRHWLTHTWYRIVGSGDEKHLKAGTSVRTISSRKRASSYLAGYLAKREQTWEDEAVGRYWGKFNVKRLPFSELEPVTLSPEAQTIAARTLRKLRQSMRKAQRQEAIDRGAPIRKRVKHRTGSFWVECNTDALLLALPRLVAAKAEWQRERKEEWVEAGWPLAPGRNETRMRQHPGPRGLSASTVQPARRLSALRPHLSTLLPTPGKGVGSIGASDASGGLLWYGGCQTTGVVRKWVGRDDASDVWKDFGQEDRVELQARGLFGGCAR